MLGRTESNAESQILTLTTIEEMDEQHSENEHKTMEDFCLWNNEWIVVIITQVGSLIVLLLTYYFDKNKHVKEYEREKSIKRIENISRIVPEANNIINDYIHIISKNDSGEQIEKLRNDINQIHIQIMDNCSIDAVKLVRYYRIKMDIIRMDIIQGRDMRLDNSWLLSYLVVLHSVLKYEITGERIPARYYLSYLFEGVSDKNKYKGIDQINEIVNESKISKIYKKKIKRLNI